MSTAGPPRATVSLRGFTPPRCQRKEPLRVAHPRRFTGPAGLRRGTRRLVLQAGIAIRLLRGGSRGAKWAAYVKNEYTVRSGTFAARPWLRNTQTSGPQKKADYGALSCKNLLSSDGGVTWSPSLPLTRAPANGVSSSGRRRRLGSFHRGLSEKKSAESPKKILPEAV